MVGSQPDSKVGAQPAVIQLRDVHKIYGAGESAVHALRGVDLTVRAGEFVAIMGASGSGKSTLLNLVGCLDGPTRGSYHLDGIDVASLDERRLATLRNRRIGFVFQSFNLIPRTSALANVELPLIYAGVARRDRRARAEAALEQVGLSDRARHRPSELSGGQQQRVAIARALVTAPALVLADEPTGNLDTASAAEVLDLLADLNDTGRTVAMITHDAAVAGRANRLVSMVDGQIVADESTVVPAAAWVDR